MTDILGREWSALSLGAVLTVCGQLVVVWSGVPSRPLSLTVDS